MNSVYFWNPSWLLSDMVAASAREEAKEKTSTIALRARMKIWIEGLEELHREEATENENGDGVGTPIAGDK